MKEINRDIVRTFGYRLGQSLAVVIVLCAMAILIGITATFLSKLF